MPKTFTPTLAMIQAAPSSSAVSGASSKPVRPLLIDCLLSDEHVFESEVTDYPVESGADVTDNVRPKPIQITMECIVSNSPINSEVISSRSDVTKSADEAYAYLLAIRDAREPVTIRTSIKTYNSMVLQSLTIPKSGSVGDGLRFTCVWREVIIVSNTRSTRVASPRAVGAHGLNTSPVAASPKAANLYRVFKFAGDWYWFDESGINGWRAFAEPPQTGRDVLSTAQQYALIITGKAPLLDMQVGPNWQLLSSHPFFSIDGIKPDFLSPKTDAQYRADIAQANAQTGVGGAPLAGTLVRVGSNVYERNPYFAPFANVTNYQLVHGVKR